MEKLLSWVVNHDEISLLCCPNFSFMNSLKKLGIEVDNINYDINFLDMPSVICKDFVFDDIPLKKCIINYNCEKTYPVGRIHQGIFILRGDNKEHNGDCNPIFSVNDLIEQNNLTEVFDQYQVKSRNKKYTHYYVYGTNI
tara:strand:- start:1316 stop:1735 length:420 start_codon:yes stop_codon:yes gene_type:complete